MSDEQNAGNATNAARDAAKNVSSSNPAAESADGAPVQPHTQEEMEALIAELRAEVTRLKVEQAKTKAQTWVQRNPAIALLLASGLGAVAGAGIARATRPTPPTLSEHARQELDEILDEARHRASGLGRDVTERASKAREQARSRAQETGKRLAQEAESVTALARERAREFGQLASERAQSWSEELAQRAQELQAASGERARRLRAELVRDVARAEDEVGRRAQAAADVVRTSIDENRTVAGTVSGVLALAAGAYLARTVRNWLDG